MRDWWRRKSGRAKTVTVLAALELLQIGLCFGTPTALSWHDALLHVRSNVPFRALGPMIWEAILCVVTLVLLVAVGLQLLADSLGAGDRGKLHD